MLQRNLLYTAVTRCKGLVLIVGRKEALSMAVKGKQTRRVVQAARTAGRRIAVRMARVLGPSWLFAINRHWRHREADPSSFATCATAARLSAWS
jgi:hypothetical protein